MSKALKEAMQEWGYKHPSGHVLKASVKDPLATAVRKVRREAEAAYRQTNQYKLDQLIRERTKWLRRETIARNKLEALEDDIRLLCRVLAVDLDKQKEGAK